MNKRRSTILVLLILLFSTMSVVSSRAQDTATNPVDYMKEKATRQFFSGSVLITKDGDKIFCKSYGFANFERSVPNTPDTKFRIGSMTKQFTAMAIMILQEQGKLTVQDTIGKLLSDMPPSWQPITIHQLLTHTSGLMHSWELPEFRETMMVPSTPDQALARFKDKPLLSEPGKKFHYSGLGYFILAKIIENVSGMPYVDFLRKHIFDPLQMNDTGDDSQASVPANLSSGYIRDGESIENAPPVYMPIMTGGGNLYSTVYDLSKWDQALNDGQLISKASYEAMYTPVKENYAYGWIVLGEGNRKRIEHGGGVPGFNSNILRVPGERLCIIVLSNSTPGYVGQISNDLEAIVFGKSSEETKR
jgi:CubicO group peptidase (beta-lactamase class C family)